MRRAAKVDGNHGEIVRALRRVGCAVLDLSRLGGGVPDLLVRRGRVWTLLEIKTPKGRVRQQQIDFAHQWPVVVVRSVDEAIQAVQG